MKIEMLEKLLCSLNKKKYVVRMQTFKQAPNRRLVMQQCREQLKSGEKIG